MSPHSIRLREPWIIAATHDGLGRQFRRGFHRPTISAGEQVRLVCERPTCDATVWLDDHKLGDVSRAEETWSCDVTNLLSGRHELRFDIFEPADSGDDLLARPWREVRLEIHPAATT